MLKRLVKYCGGVLLCIVLCFGGIVWLSNANLGVASSVAGNIRCGILSFIDSEFTHKEMIRSFLEGNASLIAQAIDVPASAASDAVKNLAIDSWETCTVPEGVTATKVLEGDVFGVRGTLVLYSDPAYISVSANGVTMSYKIPASAQAYFTALQQ